MSGISMMMKSMGIDPAEIEATVKNMGQMVIDMKSSVDRIEAKLDTLILGQIAITDNFSPNGETEISGLNAVENIGGNGATEKMEIENNG